MLREWERSRTPLGDEKAKKQFIIAMSANAEDADIGTALHAGADHFLKKPVKVMNKSQIPQFVFFLFYFTLF